MNRELEKSTGGIGLVANGTSRLWDVEIDESLDRDNEWSCQIEGPNAYLVFQLRNLKVVTSMIDFLQRGPECAGGCDQPWSEEKDSLTIGKFGRGTVSLLRDNERPPRCFLVISPKAKSVLRLTFHEEDIAMLLEALSQVAKDLPPDC
jgi:hypothetical protein